jgi:ribosomal protein S18 acetylase RimI-like enzyme
MENIAIEVVKDGNIELCRELCNELMAFQRSKAAIAPEKFDTMNFDTRMKKSYESSLESQVIVVKDNGIPVGYVFSTIENIENSKSSYPEWAPIEDIENSKGFYPEWDNLPKKIGCLNNLYLRDKYRDMGLGSRLFEMSMEWLESFMDVDLVFIYVSNGNDAALNFYLSRGFTFSHEFLAALSRLSISLKNKKFKDRIVKNGIDLGLLDVKRSSSMVYYFKTRFRRNLICGIVIWEPVDCKFRFWDWARMHSVDVQIKIHRFEFCTMLLRMGSRSLTQRMFTQVRNQKKLSVRRLKDGVKT